MCWKKQGEEQGENGGIREAIGEYKSLTEKIRLKWMRCILPVNSHRLATSLIYSCRFSSVLL